MKGAFLVLTGLFVCFGTTATKIGDFYSKFNQHEYKVTFERSTIHYVNKSLIDFELKSFVYNRTTKATNASFVAFEERNNQDLRFLVQARKFLSNEYRLFPLRFETNLCKTFSENIGGIGSNCRCGNFTGCPIKKNTKYHACNAVVDSSRFPPLVPTGQYLLELSILDQKYTWVTCYTYINVVYETKPIPSG